MQLRKRLMILNLPEQLFCLITVIILSTELNFATRTTATGSGNWFNGGVWDNGIPTCGDTVIIDSAYTILISAHVNLDETSAPPCSTAMYIEVRGTLAFSTGKKLFLACGSGIYLTDSGNLNKGMGGGSSNIIDVCQSNIWKAADGNLSGPQWVGSGLPITLKYFRAELQSEIIYFNWVTLSEINNEVFTIERSSDLKNKADIISVPGAGNSREELIYDAYDLNPQKGIQYYRLKQTDYDGSTSYSNWVAVNFEKSAIKEVSVHPTLVQSEFHINFFNQNKSVAKVYLLDSGGALILEKEIEITSDSYVHTFANDIESLSGPVFLTVFINEDKYQFKLIFN